MNENKTGEKLFKNELGAICLNPDAYNSLAADMRAARDTMDFSQLDYWFEKWLEKSGYTRDDFSVCFIKDCIYGSYDTIISIDTHRALRYLSFSYGGSNTFIFKLGMLGFLFIPSGTLGWVPETLCASISDIKNMVLLSLKKSCFYDVLFCVYIAGDPGSVVKYDISLVDCNVVDCLLKCIIAAFHYIFKGYLAEKDPDKAIINWYLTMLKSFF